MTMLTKMMTACLLLGTLLSGSALAHSTPYTHYHAKKKNKTKVKVVYRTTPAPPSRVVIVAKEPTPRPRVAVVRPTVVVTPARETRHSHTETTTTTTRHHHEETNEGPHLPLSVGVRGLGAQTSIEDGLLGEVPMGGAGVTIRSRLPDGFGIEVSADVLAGQGPGFSQTTIPVFASASYHFLPDSLLQPYALVGVGVEFGRRDFQDGRYTIDNIDLGVQAGVGAELFVTDSVSLTGDIRFKAMGTVERAHKVREDCLSESGDMLGYCDNIQSAAPGGDANLGVQFGLGANIYF